MTENGNRPMAGTMVRAKKMPNFRWPRYQKWYSTQTWLSADEAKYAGHQASGGRNFQDTAFSDRSWHVDTPPTRVSSAMSATRAMDITTPFYMLSGTAGATASTEDTLVGPDYYNPPLEMYQDIAALAQHSKFGVSQYQTMFMRILAIKHRFTFTNYSRFPLEVFYQILPIGFNFDVISGAFTPHDDMTSQTFKRIVVPAVRDAADRGQKNTVDIAVNLKQMFPDEYDMPPGPEMTSTTAALSVDSRSPWIGVEPNATTIATFRNIPPGQIADDSFSTPDLAKSGPRAGLRMVWYAKLQQPRDIGITTEGSATGGDFVGNNYDVHANCAWLADFVNVNAADQIHLGEKAYPNQAA